MAILPVTYVTTVATSLASSNGYSSQGEINIAAVSTDDVNPCYILSLHAHDARTMSTDPLTVWSTDFIVQDTDWNLVWSAGANLIAEPGFVYFKANPDTTAGYKSGVRLDGTGAELQYWTVQTYKNVRQMPACDVVVPTVDVQTASGSTPPHSYTIAPYSSDAAWLVYYNHGYLNQDLPAYTVDTDMTEVYAVRSYWVPGSDYYGMRSGMHWGNRDTDWTVLKANFSGSALEDTRTAVFQIYPYEVVLSTIAGTLLFGGSISMTARILKFRSIAGTLLFGGSVSRTAWLLKFRSVAGTLLFGGSVSRKTKLIRLLAGTLSFTQGVLVTLKMWKATLDAVIRMWLEPQADPIEIDVAPKGFTDIGEDA